MAALRLIDIHQLGDFFFRKTVAVVGNAPEVLHQSNGQCIDSHDVVVRMNAGVPRGAADALALGARTDVLTVGRTALLYKALKYARPRMLMFMKLTATGDQEWQDLTQHMRDGQWPKKLKPREDMQLFRWPQDQEDRVLEKVGSPPSTGIRVLDFLQQWGRPRLVSVFGCNWFGAAGGSRKSWWNMQKDPATAHVGRNEFECFKRMGFERMADGYWRSRKFGAKRPASWDDR